MFDEKSIHPAQFYNLKRIHLFSTLRKHNFSKASNLLQSWERELGRKAYAGLAAELGFFNSYQQDLGLTPGLDAGDHTDFTSSNGDRIDVTTNPNYKKLSQYEPIQKKEGASYKIAVVDRCGRLYKLVDINFPFCDVCEQGRLIDVVVLKELDNNYHGEQILVQICSHCNAGKELNRIQTPFLAPLSSTLSEEMQAYEDRSYEDHLFEPESHRKKAHSRYISTTLPYLHRTFDKSIIALGEVRGEMPDPRDVDWIESNLSIFWRDPMKLFDDYVLESYFLDPDSRFHDDIIY